MCGQLEDARLPVQVEAAEADAGGLQWFAKGGLDSVAAVKGLNALFDAVELAREAVWLDSDRVVLATQRARERDDGELIALRMDFGVIGMRDPKQVAGKFDHDVLEPTARPEER